MIWVNYYSIHCRYASFMFICICHAVNDSTIRRVVSDGVLSFRDLSLKTGCGTQCGTCVAQARAVMNETLADLGLAESEVKLSVVSSA